jgi:hypothetical protein
VLLHWRLVQSSRLCFRLIARRAPQATHLQPSARATHPSVSSVGLAFSARLRVWARVCLVLVAHTGPAAQLRRNALSVCAPVRRNMLQLAEAILAAGAGHIF